LTSYKLDKPVIVVGNISLGGTGKTPLVQYLVRLLRNNGLQPAILTRGYKSDFEAETLLLEHGDISQRAGDEANMLSELCGCPVAVGADRVKSAKELLLKVADVDVLIADDGLQHYAMQRDIEIIVQHGQAYGNGFCLPAGPLREPRFRMLRSDLVIDRDSADVIENFGLCWNLRHPENTRPLESFIGEPVHALAGIGFPQQFFDRLEKIGLQLDTHAFTDHHAFNAQDIEPFNDRPLLVTHKDAVKLRAFCSKNIWVVPLELRLSDELQSQLLNTVEKKLHG
jgi:tetraacyldisaccharide 4'-kinase